MIADKVFEKDLISTQKNGEEKKKKKTVLVYEQNTQRLYQSLFC